ncbi:hypothetical protein M5689_008546 [Euphorbia peplus]|nr:hypothetical protein M5689_008546 [Euphorbia peplus]
MLRKHGILKLVHPGGFVEIHMNPVKAYEIMKKNPRHCVTRPDVFKFPWIVVRPESVLNIGSVFYIVPFHTIHRLLRRKRCPFEDSELIQQQIMDSSPVELTYFHELMQEQRQKLSPVRRKVDLKIDDFPDGEMFPKCMIQENECLDGYQCQVREPRFDTHLELHGFDDSPKQVCSDGHWSTEFTYEDRKEASSQARRDSSILRRPLFDIASNIADIDQNFRRDDSGLRSDNHLNESKVLKSCLKKENNGTSRGLKVQFFIPSENGEKMNIKQALNLQTKFP